MAIQSNSQSKQIVNLYLKNYMGIGHSEMENMAISMRLMEKNMHICEEKI